MTDKVFSYGPSLPEEEEDDVLLAYTQARLAAPNDRTLLREWASRYPAHADALIGVSYAEFTAGISLTDPLEDGPEDAETVALGGAVLDAHFAAPTALLSLVAEAGARGLAPRAFAQSLRLDTPTLSRLNQRLLEAATLPRALVRQVAQALGRSTDEVRAYLRCPPRLATGAQYKARQTPVLRESAARQKFGDAIGGLTQADQDYWQAETESEGVLGDE